MNHRPPLSRLATVTMVSLALMGLAYLTTVVMDYVWYRMWIPSALVVGLVMLGGAALVRTRRRWAPLVGAALAALALFGAFTVGVAREMLTSPANTGFFLVSLLMTVSGVTAVLAGVAATVQGVRGRPAADAEAVAPPAAS